MQHHSRDTRLTHWKQIGTTCNLILLILLLLLMVQPLLITDYLLVITRYWRLLPQPITMTSMLTTKGEIQSRNYDLQTIVMMMTVMVMMTTMMTTTMTVMTMMMTTTSSNHLLYHLGPTLRLSRLSHPTRPTSTVVARKCRIAVRSSSTMFALWS